MPDCTFTFTKQFELSFEAQTEHEAWVQAMTFSADTYPTDWAVKLKESVAKKQQELPIDQGPVEVDDWDFDPNEMSE